MKTIKFRGKRVNRREWVYSTESFVQTDEGICMGLYNEEKDVIPDTIGQFTGLYDKDGKAIYEGDIIQSSAEDYNSKHEIIYVSEEAAFKARIIGSPIDEYCSLYKEWIEKFSKVVIGNIHDNPELLKGGNHGSK